MDSGAEGPKDQSASYRASRRAFIAACEKAHVETVARLHPTRGPDGKPLFMDCAARGARHAARAVLAIAYDAPGSDLLIPLLREPRLPLDARLVLVHALDPAAFAGVPGDPAWPVAMLGAVVTEDLSHVRHLGMLPLLKSDSSLISALAAQLSDASITLLPEATSAASTQRAVINFLDLH